MPPRRIIWAPRRGGIALLEVVFALSLFAAAAAVICSSFGASASSVSRMHRQAVADNLAVTLLSEMQLDIVPAEDDGPYEFAEPFENWTWEVVTAEMDEVIDVDGPVLMSAEDRRQMIACHIGLRPWGGENDLILPCK